MVYSTRRFVLCLTLCNFVLVFFGPFSIAITSLGEESAFRTFVRFVLVWICRFPLSLGVWKGLRFAIVALPGLFSYLFYYSDISFCKHEIKSIHLCESYWAETNINTPTKTKSKKVHNLARIWRIITNIDLHFTVLQNFNVINASLKGFERKRTTQSRKGPLLSQNLCFTVM